MKPGKTGVSRIIDAAGYSIAGLKATLEHEAAFRQECLLFVLLLPLAFWLGESATEWALLIVPLFIVLITEVLNSAIEAVVDMTSPEPHSLAGRAKDMGSAAVFLSLMLTLTVWGLLLWQRFSS